MSENVTLPDTVHTIPEALAFWAERTPDAPALIMPGRPTITYETLWQSAKSLAESLNRCGVGRNDRIVLLLPEGPDLATALLGTMSAGIATPLDCALTVTELSSALQGLGAVAAIVQPPLDPATREYLSDNGLSVFELGANGALRTSAFEVDSARRAEQAVPPRAEDIAVLLHTSGTTGKAKRVQHTHGTLIGYGRRHCDWFDVDRSDRALSVAPMTLSLGQTTLVYVITAGAALICPSLSDPASLWKIIEAERPTWMFASAGFMELLARFLRGRPPRSGSSSLRFVRVTSGPLSPEVSEELARQLGAPIFISYSSSEAGGIAMALPPPAAHKPGSAGQPVQEVRIVDAAGNSLGAKAVGEIVVRGPQVFAGYVDDAAANAAAFFPDGWFRTGDFGYLDEDGFLFVTGRVDELINRGGEKIAPMEVDGALRSHAAVMDAATFAIPDARLGQDIVAAVVLEPGTSAVPRELRSWMLDRLSPYKVPRRIWMVKDLPRTATGKVRRGELARRWAETHG